MVRSGVAWVVALMVVGAGIAAAAPPEDHLRRVVGDGFEGLYIVKVPDESQPPPNPLGVPSVDNWCAPLAAANALVFLDQVAGAEWASDVSGGLPAGTLSAYLGHFMATNEAGCPDRVNAQSRRPGTLTEDIPAGIVDFAAWEGDPPPGALPKHSQRWSADLLGWDVGDAALIDAYAASIEQGIPVILCFAFWNPVAPRALILLTSVGDVVTFTAYEWGEPLASTSSLRKEDPKVPHEEWDEKGGIGHAVTGVGFVKDRERLWVIVHDTWSTTAEDVVVPWNHVIALVRLGPM